MEPQTCTAHVRPDGVEVWAPSQDVGTTLATAADAAGVADDKVIVHGMMLGGGFGRRGPIQDFVRQAVLIAKEVDAPVKLLWSREEDIAHDLYRPFGMARLAAGLDAAGMPIALSIRLAGPSFVASLVPEFMNNVVDRSYVSGLADEMHLRRAELHGRLRHPRHPRAARRLARHQLHAERVLQGMLHRRTGARSRHRSLSVSAAGF